MAGQHGLDCAERLPALALIPVGAVLYREAVTPGKVLGVIICLIGLYVIVTAVEKK